MQFNTQLGHGAFKEVFKGYDEEEGNEIAWCQVVMDRVGETEKRAIAQEVELLKNVQHKHILAFIDCFELESPSKPIVFITEYMSSGTLKQCACAARACTTSARGLADALLPAQVHQQGEARQAQGDQEVVPADARRAGLPAQVADHPPRPQVREHLHQRQHRRDQDRRPRPIDNDEGRRAASAERARCVAPRPTRMHRREPPPKGQILSVNGALQGVSLVDVARGEYQSRREVQRMADIPPLVRPEPSTVAPE